MARPMLSGASVYEPADSVDLGKSELPEHDFDLVDPKAMAVRQLIVGVMLVVVGVVVTAATYTTAHYDGDRYFLAFGPIVIGAIAMVRGFIGLLRP